MFLRKVSLKTYFYGFFIFVLLGALFYSANTNGARSTVTQQLLDRQLVIAKAQASNLSSFFRFFGESLVGLSRSLSVGYSNKETVDIMDVFVTQWRESGLIGGIVLTDEEGIVRFNSNVLGTRDLGSNLSDRDYFIWAKGKAKEGEYFVGNPIISRVGASKGEYIVPVATPIFKDDSFAGVLASSVKLDPLVNRFLKLLRVSDINDIYLISDGGEFIFASSEIGAKGELEMLTKLVGEGKFQYGRYLVAHSPVQLTDSNWLLVVVTPDQEIWSITTPLYVRLAFLIVLVILTTIFFVRISYKNNRT